MVSPCGIEAQGDELLVAAVDFARATWRGRLTAAYALGSLAHSGFSPVSDVDVGLVLSDPLLSTDHEGVASLVESIKATNKPFSDRLSVFWGSVGTLSGAQQGGRFPPLDRLDLIKYGRLLRGMDIRGKLSMPTRKELVVAGAEFALWRLATDEVTLKLKNPESLARSDAKTLTKLILYPVRFMFTAQTGEVGRNEAAVDYLLGIAKNPASELARLALDWRNSGSVGSEASAIRAIAAGVLPLYERFLSDHESRLKDYERQDLAEAFGTWRRRLLT